MDTGEKCLYVLEDVRAKISLLEKAIDEVGSVKKSLKISAADVKAQIRDNISRHLEALRNRETWLLSQVEVLQHGKEDVLRLQHAELNQAVGTLKHALALLHKSDGKSEHIEEQLMHTIQAMEKFSLQPEESGFISFRALNMELLDHIRRFGMVTADDSLQGSLTEISLDGDVNGGKRKYSTQSDCHQDYVDISKWLNKIQLAEATNHIMPNSPVKFAYIEELKKSAMSQWIKNLQYPPAELPKSNPITETYSRIAALGPEHWLAYKQRQHDERSLAETLKELQKMRDLQPELWLKRTNRQAPPEVVSILGETYAKIAATGPEMWLNRNEGEVPAEVNSVLGEAYARIAATPPEIWLKTVKGNAAKEDYATIAGTPSEMWVMKIHGETPAVPESNNVKVFAKIAATSPDIWLKKNQVLSSDTKASPAEDYARISATPIDQWLQPKPSCGKTEACADCKCVSISTDSDMGDASDADDWLNIKKEDVVSIEDLDTLLNPQTPKPSPSLVTPAHQPWILQPDPAKASRVLEDSSGIKGYSDMLNSQPIKNWLHDWTNITEPLPSSGFKEYMDSLPASSNYWLAGAKPRDDICQWLARSSTKRCKECPKSCSNDLFGMFLNAHSTGSDGWLLKPST
ncbi:predicted protein [Nematostella vectensis]|uniref:Nuclear receptor coactivator 4 N-terminal domain-containing protein n=1 Tax=Nematostella vectensis TaxID=45351 RepID=A7RQ97_NEMVE|nr:predicted protein [Nematostella vectensis]|eukprot:XP_001638385.1 predicted protein [Nematostella vectensis]